MDDPIVSEVRKHRKEILESYGSMQSYHKAVMEQQKQYGNRLVMNTSKCGQTNLTKENTAEKTS